MVRGGERAPGLPGCVERTTDVAGFSSGEVSTSGRRTRRWADRGCTVGEVAPITVISGTATLVSADHDRAASCWHDNGRRCWRRSPDSEEVDGTRVPRRL